jgi:phosphoglycolate phosphatase
MAIKVMVFDFDGTLVESNQLKYEAYLQLFPADERHQTIIRSVLAESVETSRYENIAEILKQLGEDADELTEKVNILAQCYSNVVTAGAKTCAECPGAEQLLQQLSVKYSLYLSSTTPETDLRDIVSFRKWDRYFKEIFGYPHKKAETLREIGQREHICASEVLVVGDGDSDRVAAAAVGCHFLNAKDHPLSAITLWTHRK